MSLALGVVVRGITVIFAYFSGIFVSNLSSTLGVDFQVKTIRVDGRNIALQLWDTAGIDPSVCHRFRLTKQYDYF